MKITKDYLKRLIKEEMRKTFISERKEKITMTKDFSFEAGPGSPTTYRQGQTIPGWEINDDGDAEKRIGYSTVVIPSDHFELSSGDSASASRSDRSYQTMQNHVEKVWVVIEDYYYEGQKVVAVFDSEEGARAHAKKLKSRGSAPSVIYDVKEFTLNQ